MTPHRAAPMAVQAEEHQQYLTFVLGRETFALGIQAIREILEYSVPTDIPMMPAFIRGLVNLRGAAVPVIDLSVRFGRASAPVGKRTCIVILETGGEARRVLGVVVDAVNEVLEIAGGDIEPPPSFGASIRTDFIRGMGKVRGKFVIILDIERLLSADDVAAVTGMCR